jgi:hypothetical protein
VSWDIFVQDIPEHAVSLDDIAEDFKPKLLVSRSNVIGAILKFAPFADVSDPTWVRIQGRGADIEVSLGDHEQVAGFTFHGDKLTFVLTSRDLPRTRAALTVHSVQRRIHR